MHVCHNGSFVNFWLNKFHGIHKNSETVKFTAFTLYSSWCSLDSYVVTPNSVFMATFHYTCPTLLPTHLPCPNYAGVKLVHIEKLISKLLKSGQQPVR